MLLLLFLKSADTCVLREASILLLSSLRPPLSNLRANTSMDSRNLCAICFVKNSVSTKFSFFKLCPTKKHFLWPFGNQCLWNVVVPFPLSAVLLTSVRITGLPVPVYAQGLLTAGSSNSLDKCIKLTSSLGNLKPAPPVDLSIIYFSPWKISGVFLYSSYLLRISLNRFALTAQTDTLVWVIWHFYTFY